MLWSLFLYVRCHRDAAATTPRGEGWKKLRRKGRMADGADAPGTPRSPTVYDWCVL
jgi:hypothetical protein